jgi:hypothetical protein
MKPGIFAVLAVLAVALIATAGVATAAPAGKSDAQVLGDVRIDPSDPTVAYVTARYICQNGMTEQTHLWVSVKQTAERSPDNRLKEEGSSEVSAAWSQSHPRRVLWSAMANGTPRQPCGVRLRHARAGQGSVQFCLFGGDGTFASSNRFAEIK